MSAALRLCALTAGLVALCLALWGTAPFGRLALSLGQPRIALLLLDDPAWRGVARFRAGDAAGAARDFAAAGPDMAHNRGVALAHAGAYAAALEAWDIALAVDPGDRAARRNFDLVAAFYGATEIDPFAPVKWFDKEDEITMEAPVGLGNGRAAGTGDSTTNTGANMGLPDLISQGRLGVRQNFDGKMIVASERWLTTLADLPGAYLAARLKEEHKRREDLGTDQPEAADPW